MWKRMLLKCFITMVFTCPLLSCCTISSPLRENNNVEVSLFPFHIFMLLAKLWFIHIQGWFPIIRSCLTSTCSSALQEDHWHLVEGESLSWNSFGPLLCCHFFPLGGMVGIFPSLQMRPEGISHISPILLERFCEATMFRNFV